jgi:hypothetical protein
VEYSGVIMTVNMIGRVIHMKTEPKILQRWKCEVYGCAAVRKLSAFSTLLPNPTRTAIIVGAIP